MIPKMAQSGITLREKLDDFIRKYHRVQLARGIVSMIGIYISALIIAGVLEYIGRFGVAVRSFLFFTLLALTLYLLVNKVIQPILQLLRISRKALNYERASLLIGAHFPEVKDKLLNVLQLQEMQSPTSQNELLIAAVERKTSELAPLPFTLAIDKEGLVKAAKFGAIPLLALVLIGSINRSVFTESTQRILQFRKEFIPPAPFSFAVNNEKLSVVKNTDFTLLVSTQGDELPEDVYVEIGGSKLKMEKISKGKFAYTLRNLQSTRSFFISSGPYRSENYILQVIPKALVTHFKVQLLYPNYLQKKPETLSNLGDITVPAGTNIIWSFSTKDVDAIALLDGENSIPPDKHKQGVYSFSHKALKSTLFQLVYSNALSSSRDSIPFAVNVIADAHPSVFVEDKKDSSLLYGYFIIGEANDDYGLERLQMFYRIQGKESVFKKMDIPLKGNNPRQTFYHFIQLPQLGVKEGDNLEYYLQIWDNDRVNGSKSSKTAIRTLRRESDEELDKQLDESGKAMMSAMQSAMQKAAEIQQKLQKMEKDFKQKDALSWEEKQKMEKLLEEQKKLQQEVEKLKEEFSQRKQLENQFKEPNESLKKKQEQIQKMMEELFDDKTKELFKKLEDLLKEQNKEKVREQLNKLNKENRDLEKMLDKTLEQFKQLELEKKINESVEKLQKLAEKQEQLKQETEKSDKQNGADLLPKQEEINKAFDKLQNDLQEIEQLNKNLERPLDIDPTKEQQQSIEEHMDNASSQLQQNKKKNAAKEQQSAADKLKEMSDKMESKLRESQDQQQEEDYQALRQLLKNLVILSNSQEDLMLQFRGIKDYTPRYISLAKKQKDLRQSAGLIEDSLNALAKRQPTVKSIVTKELGSLVYNLDAAIAELSERNTSQATVKQQYAMTHTNNLALFLTEALKQMQEQMNANKDKDGKPQEGEPNASCDKPGKSGMGKSKPKPSTQGMQQLQERLNKAIKEMQDGEMKGGGKGPNSEEIAKIAAQQEALRKELEKFEKSLQEQGLGNSELAKEIAETKQKMEEVETQLYNKKLDRELIRKQEEISHRLFEHEKAEREQGEDEKRIGEKPGQAERKLPPSLELYLKEKNKEMEFYQTLPVELSPYYRERVKEYYDRLNSK